MGRSPESIERRKAHAREKARFLYQFDAEYRAKKIAKDKSRREKNAESERAKSKARYEANREKRIEQRKQWARDNRDKQNATQRDYYESNRDKLRARIYSGKDRRDPTRGLVAEFRRFKRGDITFDQLIECVGDRIIRLDERLKEQSAGHSGEALRSRASTGGRGVRKPNHKLNENETRPPKVSKKNKSRSKGIT